MSSALNGWKYDVFKFETRKPVDISTWPTPVKLNRKEIRRNDEAPVAAAIPVGPMIGPDGMPVVDGFGRQVMLDKDGKPIRLGSDGNAIAPKPFDPNANKGKGRFGKKNAKKVKQVHKTSEDVRAMRREERYPWVIEDAMKSEVWVASMEETSKADMFAFFMPAANDAFKFVPAHRWYKFQKKFNHYLPTLEEAEKVMDKIKKNKDPQTWLLHKKKGQGASSATAAIFKAEAEGRSLAGGLVYDTAGPSLGPGGRRLRAVDSGGDLFGDDDSMSVKKEDGAEGDLEELDFEEDFADDDEKMNINENEDEEAKELEDRLKREYKNANRERNDSDDDDDALLTKEGKKMKKIIRNNDKSNMYDSDDEENPYASSGEESEEEEIPTMTQAQAAAASKEAQEAAQLAAKAQKPQGSAAPSTSNSRASSPTPAAPSMGGHSLMAKRATSPKAPKPKATNGYGRATSPLAGGSRASSPVGPDSRATSPNGTSRPSNKRKATDDSSAPTSPTAQSGQKPPKKRKAMPGAPVAGELDEKLLVEWLSNTTTASTRDCIQHFSPYLTDESKKARFTALVKEVAQLKGGILVLKSAYKAGSPAAPSPAA